MEKKFSPRFKDWRIRTKLLVVMLALSWLPLLVIMGINIQNQIKTSQTEIENQILSLVTGSVYEIKLNTIQFIDKNHDDLLRLANGENMLELLSIAPQFPDQPPGSNGDQPSQQPDQEDPNQTPPDEANPLADLGSSEYKLLRQEVSQFLLEYCQANQGVQEASVLNLQGIIIASSEIRSIGARNRMRDDVVHALAGDQYTENIHLGPESNAPGFFISTPIYGGSEIVGVLSMRLQADFIVTALTEREYEYGTFFIANNYGIIMAHSDPTSEWLFKSLNPLDDASLQKIEEAHLMGNYDEPLISIPAAQSLGEALTEAIELNSGGLLRYCHFDSVTQAMDEKCKSREYNSAAYEVVNDPISGKVLFTIFADLPEHIFTGPVEQQIVFSIIGSVVMAILLIVTSLLVAQSIANPIRAIANSAEAVEQDQPFDPDSLKEISTSLDEIGAFARVFSKMVKIVQEREQKLKKTVAKLQIQINQSKREEEVQKIVGGDFFQDLQSRAKEMRRRKEDMPQKKPPKE